MRLTKHMTAPPALFHSGFPAGTNAGADRKAIEMRLATLLTLVLKFPVTTALLYSQEVHYNYERGANFSAYKTYQWVDTPTAVPKVRSGKRA